MIDEYYPEIVLQGVCFSPKALIQEFDVHIEKANESGDYNPRLKRPYTLGYCILRPNKENDGQLSSISCLMDQYRMIHNRGLGNLSIEKTAFYLTVSTLQNKTSIPCDCLQEIVKYFRDFNISMVSS